MQQKTLFPPITRFDTLINPIAVKKELDTQYWSIRNISQSVDLSAWRSFLRDLPPDPYVESRFKRMSWLHILRDGSVQDMGECAMAQGGNYNDACTMANKNRYYQPLESAFIEREDVQSFVADWAKLWGIGVGEPILMQITGVRGNGQIDPLQGQGIHADGCTALSIVLLSRENVYGATNYLYNDKEGTQPIATVVLNAGDILHLCDDKLFHNVDRITEQFPDVPFERFVIIINSRFVDNFQNDELRKCFPSAVLYGDKCRNLDLNTTLYKYYESTNYDYKSTTHRANVAAEHSTAHQWQKIA
ncbi:2OG-Fe dioxygenase family protein [Pseudanabaena sp. UWO311]|uniref:2OG-Fe dioxygenase family protein n=1 Tax=Pseudanabaena sp. UWO311 TaxID=2487337 RepID=UPI00115A1AA4|nr:2OG-Fe dioxygenase family protein [Pseudanabaena sp. UWO311]TYQ26456.1 2OG-Fe dioxygenase family protein [Pseudanabaena sp. UWO311]